MWLKWSRGGGGKEVEGDGVREGTWVGGEQIMSFLVVRKVFVFFMLRGRGKPLDDFWLKSNIIWLKMLKGVSGCCE